MPADNATNTARHADAETRVLTAVATLRSRGEPLGMRAIARLAGASLSTVRKLRHRWQSEADAITVARDGIDDTQWRDRLAVFQPQTVEAYLHSVWPEPVTPQTIARWHAQMVLLRQLYRTTPVHLAQATYRIFADWMNAVLDDAQHHFGPRALEEAVSRWEGDPGEMLLADGALAGIKLPERVKNELTKARVQQRSDA